MLGVGFWVLSYGEREARDVWDWRDVREGSGLSRLSGLSGWQNRITKDTRKTGETRSTSSLLADWQGKWHVFLSGCSIERKWLISESETGEEQQNSLAGCCPK